jgi:cytochrome c553
MRGIAPCGACHGSLDNKTGSPWLEGQSEAYMKAQLQAFASGERRNDISQQMRNIARAMTPQEIEQAAAYYASQPPDVVKAVDGNFGTPASAIVIASAAKQSRVSPRRDSGLLRRKGSSQ